MLRKLLLAWLLALTASPLAHAQPQPQPAAHVINSVPELTDSIRRMLPKEHIPGLMLVLATRDSVLFVGGLGEANRTTHQPVTAHTLFRIGSITKSFIALGLLQLIEQGKLHLNDEVRKIAPEVPIDNPWEATDPVRVVHLLEHTAGFDDVSINHFFNHTATDLQGLANVELFRAELRCRWRPGERSAYSNPGYVVAGYLLEKFSGQPYEQYLTQHFVRPLGMPDATPTPRPAALPQLAQGYKYLGGQYVPQSPLALYPGAAGSMNASATDMARYVQFFLRGGRTAAGTALVSLASLREMETVHSTVAARGGLPTGYGLANYELTIKGKAVFRGHTGEIPGFASALGYNRELGLGYALSNNGDERARRIERLVQRFLLRPAPRATPPAPVALAATDAAAYLGHYRFVASRYQLDYPSRLLGGMSLVRRGPLLLLLPLIGKPDTLLATGPRTFRRPSELVSSTVLAHDAEGRRVLVVSTEDYYGVEAGFWWWLPPALFGLSSLLMVTAGVAGLIWLVYALRCRLPAAQILPRLLPLLAGLAWGATYWAIQRAGFDYLSLGGRLNLETILLFAGPLTLTVCTLAGIGLLLYRFGQFRSRFVAWYLLLAYGGLAFVTVVLIDAGWLGLRLWSV